MDLVDYLFVVVIVSIDCTRLAGIATNMAIDLAMAIRIKIQNNFLILFYFIFNIFL